jgi:hypothetical protein
VEVIATACQDFGDAVNRAGVTSIGGGDVILGRTPADNALGNLNATA